MCESSTVAPLKLFTSLLPLFTASQVTEMGQTRWNLTGIVSWELRHHGRLLGCWAAERSTVHMQNGQKDQLNLVLSSLWDKCDEPCRGGAHARLADTTHICLPAPGHKHDSVSPAWTRETTIFRKQDKPKLKQAKITHLQPALIVLVCSNLG